MEDLEQSLWEIGALEPLIDIYEKEDEIIVRADLPTVEKEDIKVFCTGRSLEISAKMRREVKFERWGTLQRELIFDSYKCAVGLPQAVDCDKVTARFKSGFLILRLPKKTKKRQISVG